MSNSLLSFLTGGFRVAKGAQIFSIAPRNSGIISRLTPSGPFLLFPGKKEPAYKIESLGESDDIAIIEDGYDAKTLLNLGPKKDTLLINDPNIKYKGKSSQEEVNKAMGIKKGTKYKDGGVPVLKFQTPSGKPIFALGTDIVQYKEKTPDGVAVTTLDNRK